MAFETLNTDQPITKAGSKMDSAYSSPITDSSSHDSKLLSSSAHIAISAHNISKMYPLYADPRDRLKQSLWYALPRFLRGNSPPKFFREFWALRDVSFELKRGEALGIIGRNGSGKSTLLQIIAGTLTPTAGEVEVNGRIAALLELGSGFNAEFTGRENVYLNGAILGFSREEMEERFDEIAAFADIGDFIDQPVKHYSSGMFVRLAFAVQACVEPDILIVDEALSVGDIFFQQKCHERMEKLLERDTAIIVVSHDMTSVEKYSNQILLLDQGRTAFLGKPDEAIQRYVHQMERISQPLSTSISSLGDTSELNGNEPEQTKVDMISDWPAVTDAFLDFSQAIIIGAEEKIAECRSIALCNSEGQGCAVFKTGEVAHFFYEFELLQDIEVPVGGVTLWNSKNTLVHGKNSLHYLLEVPSFVRKGKFIRFRQSIELALAPDEYTFTVGLATLTNNNYDKLIKAPFSDYPSYKVLTLLRVRQAGRILIQPQTHGITIPFQGYANLRGDCILAVS